MRVIENFTPAFIDKIQEVIYKYLWNNKRAKIRSEVLHLPKEHGGLRLMDFRQKHDSLKIWINTIEESAFLENIANSALLPKMKQKTWHCNIPSKQVNKIIPNESVWREVLRSWSKYNFLRPVTLDEITNQIIWYNSMIEYEWQESLCVRAWEADLVQIEDMINNKGDFLSYEELIAKYGRIMTWLDYKGLLYAIPNLWKEKIRRSNKSFQAGSFEPSNYYKLVEEHKLSHIVYSAMIKNENLLEDKRIKWQVKLEQEIDIKEFLRTFKNLYKVTIATKYRDFQFRLIHRIIPTAVSLHCWGILDSNSCRLCNQHIETIEHLFWGCPRVQDFWRGVIVYLQEQNVITNFDLSCKNVLFNLVHPKPGSIINFIFLIGKQFI